MTLRWRLLASSVAVGGLLGLAGVMAPAAHSEVSAACWAHLAGVKQSNTPAADRRYHLERGEASPCTEADANDGQQPRQQTQQRDDGNRRQTNDNTDNGDDEKSRWCRQHWYC